MKNRPEDIGLRAYGATDDAPPVQSQGNPIVASFNDLRRASHSGSFWLLAGSFFVCGASTNGLIGTHLVPAAMDYGMSEVAAASLLATMGIFDIFGTSFSGWLTDRLNARWQRGLFQSGDPVQGSASATTVRVRNGSPATTSGPFQSGADQIIGFYVLDCKDADEAVAAAAKIPAARTGAVEIRPILAM